MVIGHVPMAFEQGATVRFHKFFLRGMKRSVATICSSKDLASASLEAIAERAS